MGKWTIDFGTIIFCHLHSLLHVGSSLVKVLTVPVLLVYEFISYDWIRVNGVLLLLGDDSRVNIDRKELERVYYLRCWCLWHWSYLLTSNGNASESRKCENFALHYVVDLCYARHKNRTAYFFEYVQKMLFKRAMVNSHLDWLHLSIRCSRSSPAWCELTCTNLLHEMWLKLFAA